MVVVSVLLILVLLLGCDESAALGALHHASEGYLTLDQFKQLANHPEDVIATGDNPGEPAYLSLEEGNRGRNADGSRHGGFIVVDVIERKVVDVVDAQGVSSLKNFSGSSYRHGEPLSDWMGSFVLVGPDGWMYKSQGCRCPMIAYDVFATREDADRTAGNEGKGYAVCQINPDLVRRCEGGGHITL